MRTLKLSCGLTPLLGSLFAVAAPAQAPTAIPTVAVSVSGSAITIPAGPIAAGPTRFVFTRSGKGAPRAFLATLRAGVTVDQLRRVLAGSQDDALSLVFLEAAAALDDATPTRAVTVDLRPAVTYVAVATDDPSSAVASFNVGAPSGARAPAPDARIRMVDYGFKGPGILPRDGRIRIENRGTAFHFALAFALRRSVSARRARRALRSGSDAALGRILGGPIVSLQELISPGSSNDNEVRFPRPGR